MRRFAQACLLAATAAALRPTPHAIAAHAIAPQRMRSHSRAQRTSKLEAQAGWSTGVDAETGATFYYNSDGAWQWQPPPAAAAQRAYGTQVLWHFQPAWGVHSSYAVRNGEEQVLGRFDMLEQKPTVSRMQCLVRVAADGSARLFSLGKRPTGLRARHGAPWYGLETDPTLCNSHVLVPGEQIAVDIDSGESFGWQGTPYTAVFTCHVEQGGMQQPEAGGYQQQHGGYGYEQHGQQGGYGYGG